MERDAPNLDLHSQIALTAEQVAVLVEFRFVTSGGSDKNRDET